MDRRAYQQAIRKEAKDIWKIENNVAVVLIGRRLCNVRLDLNESLKRAFSVAIVPGSHHQLSYPA